jgi:hypothetical protein
MAQASSLTPFDFNRNGQHSRFRLVLVSGHQLPLSDWLFTPDSS